MVISGYRVPAGTTLLMPIWALHHSEANFERGAEFIPERWLEGDANPFRDSVWLFAKAAGTPRCACDAAAVPAREFL